MPASKGFTLIELLVTISIITILSVIGLISFQNVRKSAQDAKIKSDLNAIKKAYEANYDPTLNGGQGGYKGISGSNFVSGQIPTTDGKPLAFDNSNSYIVAGPVGAAVGSNFAVCALIKPTNTNCLQTPTNSDCLCATSTQGTPIDLASIITSPSGSGQTVTANYSPGFGSPSFITNGTYATEGTSWNNATYAVQLNSVTSSVLTIDLGKNYLVSRVKVQADDNDTYKVDYSTDNSTWALFYNVPTSSEGGLRTRDSGALTSITARYIRIYATSGDNAYSVSELQVF